MNFITFGAAYCLFPRATLERRTTVLAACLEDCSPKAIMKYATRGWTIVPSADSIDDPAFSSTKRHVLDSHCWRVPLNCDDHLRRQTGLTHDPAELTSWTMNVGAVDRPLATTQSFFHPLLRYSYAMADRTLGNTAFGNMVPALSIFDLTGERLDRNEWLVGFLDPQSVQQLRCTTDLFMQGA